MELAPLSSFENRECFWKIDPLPSTGIDTTDGAVSVLAVTRSTANLGTAVSLRPIGHPRRGEQKLAAIPPDLPVNTPSLVAVYFHARMSLPARELNKRVARPHDNWQLVKSEF